MGESGLPFSRRKAIPLGSSRSESAVYFLYSVLMGLAVLLTSPYWIFQGIRHRKYLSNLRERFGFLLP